MTLRKLGWLFIFAIALLFACAQSQQRHVNLISPSGRLLANNTGQLKELVAKLYRIQNPDSIEILQIIYDLEDTQTIARVKFQYQRQPEEMMIYINNVDPKAHGSLLDNCKLTAFVTKTQPVVVVLTGNKQSSTSNRDSSCKN